MFALLAPVPDLTWMGTPPKAAEPVTQPPQVHTCPQGARGTGQPGRLQAPGWGGGLGEAELHHLQVKIVVVRK